MKITSPAFKDGDVMPSKYTCDGTNIHPPLVFEDIPEGTVRLVLIMEDIDSFAGVWVHWIVWDIFPETTVIPEGTFPATGIKEGRNSFGDIGYGGPCPKAGSHRYYLRLYALDNKMEMPRGSDWSELEVEMAGHILDKAEILVTYERSL